MPTGRSGSGVVGVHLGRGLGVGGDVGRWMGGNGGEMTALVRGGKGTLVVGGRVGRKAWVLGCEPGAQGKW